MTEYTAQQRKLIEKHREINIKHDTWWDSTYADFKSEMAHTGVDVDKMMFSGFWSQGDGASFTGRISDIKLFMEHHKLAETYPAVMRLLSYDGNIDLRVVRTGGYSHYYHENTVAVDTPYNDQFSYLLPTDDPLRAAVVGQWDTDLVAEITALEEAATKIIRSDCRVLYRQLEEEYNYLTSDDAVWEAIQSNDLATEEEA